MTVLLAVVAVVALVLAVVLFVVYRRLEDAEYWRAHWRRHFDEMAQTLADARQGAAVERADVEHALRILWRRFEVVTPADGAAVAFLRAVFPSLPAPPGPRVPESLPSVGSPDACSTCPKCQDAACVAPGWCDDLFGGDAP